MQNDDVYKSQRVSTDKTGTLVYKSVIETKKPKLPIMSYSLIINSTLLHTGLQGWCVLGMVNSDTSSKNIQFASIMIECIQLLQGIWD